MKTKLTGRKLTIQPIETQQNIVKQPERKLYIQPIAPVQRQSVLDKPFLLNNKKKYYKRNYRLI